MKFSREKLFETRNSRVLFVKALTVLHICAKSQLLPLSYLRAVSVFFCLLQGNKQSFFDTRIFCSPAHTHTLKPTHTLTLVLTQTHAHSLCSSQLSRQGPPPPRSSCFQSGPAYVEHFPMSNRSSQRLSLKIYALTSEFITPLGNSSVPKNTIV